MRVFTSNIANGSQTGLETGPARSNPPMPVNSIVLCDF